MRRVAGAIGAVSVAFIFWLVGGVTNEDVAASEDVSTDLARITRLQSAGDVIAVSPDGQTVERLCGFRLTPIEENDAQVSRIYFNSLSGWLPKLIRSEVQVQGRIEHLDQERVEGFDEDCTCRMVDRIHRRHTLCLSDKLVMLSEGNGLVPLGGRVRNSPMFLSESAFRSCGSEFSPAAEAQGGACPLSLRPAWTAQVRSSLNVIDYRTN